MPDSIITALPIRQRMFVAEYLIDLNATQAAQRAGYSMKTAYSQGQRLLKKVEIQQSLQEAKANREVRTNITQDFVLERWRIEASGEGPDSNSSARVKATDSIAKHLGMLSDKVQVEHTGAPPVIQIVTAVKTEVVVKGDAT